MPCNPLDVEGLAGTIALALELPEDDRRGRIEAMVATVALHDVHRWFGTEMSGARVS
ncbi:MAG: hypothetical protein ACKVUT_17460 [Gaiella sp.]